MDRRLLDFRSYVIGWIAIIAIWAAWAHLGRVAPYLLPTPRDVAMYALENAQMLGTAAALTASQALVGLAGALVAGVLSGIILFYGRAIRRIALPIVVAIQTTPIVALAPLVSLWFGFGWFAHTVIAGVVAVLPVILATYSGLSDVRRGYIDLFRVAGVNESQILRQVRLKSAWPAVFPAIKVAAVLAVVGSIVAEFMGGDAGLGFLIMVAVYGSKARLLMAVVVIAAVIGQSLLSIVELIARPIERRLAPLAEVRR